MDMDVGEGNGGVKLEIQSTERMITYQRKRARSSFSSCLEGDASCHGGMMVGNQVKKPTRERKVKDIGWEHGMILNGNRFHWKCNWCGLIRFGGGVSRLKQHIAGGWSTVKCPKVPADIAKAMAKHLMEKKKVKRKLSTLDGNDMQKASGPVADFSAHKGLSLSTSSMQAYKANKRPQNASLHIGISVVEEVKEESHDTVSCTRTYDHDGLAKIDFNRRYILLNMLQFLDYSDDGGIRGCILDALTSCPLRRERKKDIVTKDFEQPKDSRNGAFEVQGQSYKLDRLQKTPSDLIKTGTCGQPVRLNTMKCQKVFVDVLQSEKFASLCNLLCGSFQEIKSMNLFDFGRINSKMKKGDYEQLPYSFDEDIQQVWEKFKRLGHDMINLASSLSNISRVSLQKQVGEGSTCENPEEICELLSHESDRSSIPDQVEASCPSRTYPCKHCGTETNANGLNNIQGENLHGPCEICDRLEVPEVWIDSNKNGRNVVVDNSRESSASTMESDHQPELSATAISRLCKHCGTCEGDDSRFLICGNIHCPFKFYHIRCLNSSELARQQQQNQTCWYCPSCLCRGCLSDKDDDMIVMCDGCDEAYHTYCMKPPRTSIPVGRWYCVRCNVGRERASRSRYEQLILQHHGSKDVMRSNGVNGSLDILLRAAEKLSKDEQMVSEKSAM